MKMTTSERSIGKIKIHIESREARGDIEVENISEELIDRCLMIAAQFGEQLAADRTSPAAASVPACTCTCTCEACMALVGADNVGGSRFLHSTFEPGCCKAPTH